MKKNPLIQLQENGQGVWLDYISRDIITSGELKRLVEEDALSGMTSNPTIFEKAVAASHHYDGQIEGLMEFHPQADAYFLYEKIAVRDIQEAADLLAPVYRKMNRVDGYVSLEVSPDVAQNTQATIEQARHLWNSVGRPNVMIKVPATQSGIPAIEALVSEGININITLMFSRAHYEDVARAYIRGVQRCRNVESIASVASFFVSRVDTAVDKMLESIGTPEAMNLRGKAAIANSRMIYQRFLEIFHGPEFEPLRKKGIRVQRPLWASTSTKNPLYPDVLYVEALVGNETVNTMPPETLQAFRRHGRVVPDAVKKGHPQEVLEGLARLGIDLHAVGEKLQQEGVASFASSFNKLLQALEEKNKAIH